MNFKFVRAIGLTAFCGVMAAAQPVTAFASPEPGTGLLMNYQATILADSVLVKTAVDGEEVLTEALQGATFPVEENVGDGWVRLDVGGEDGYVVADTESISIVGPNGEDITTEVQAEGEAADQAASNELRQNLVNYALQFVGGSYRYGGSDPHTGVDCSGFTRYVLQNGAGVSVARSSRSQAGQGQQVSAEQMRPGDLVFYSSGGSINHVAMYIGNGQVVHASTYETGIKTSPWNYRAPVKIMNVIGD